MAAVSISHSPHTLSAMSSRRVPLSSNPNGANSPYRAVAAAAVKQNLQKRSHATIQREEAYGQQPPAKKQILQVQSMKTPTRQASQAPEGRVFTRKSNSSQANAFARRLEAVRTRPVPAVQVSADKPVEESNLDKVKEWQKHYRRVFPKYVFYFESIPEEPRTRLVKQVTVLGARVEKFFSNAVTHVVTTRSIPSENETSSTDANTGSAINDSQSQTRHPQTINPLLLDRSSESAQTQFEGTTAKGKFTFEAPFSSRRPAPAMQDLDVRKQPARNADVLYRARDLGMKIWALEKLSRMMTTMFDTDTGMIHDHNTRSNPARVAVPALSRSAREADLSQLLRNERLNGPSDRDPTVATKEMILFKGPYIYIHDIDEKQRPIMVREYGKVAHKEDGDWPQFRSVPNGKCPFVEEVDYSRRDAEKEMARQQKQMEREKSAAPRTRATAAGEAGMRPPKSINSNRVLADIDQASNRGIAPPPTKESAPFEIPSLEGEASSKGPHNAFVSRAGAGRLYGGEPVASGVQPSNITSAIRSQMISSTAAAPGAKAGTSKEVHGLQRKVLEKNSGPASLGLTSSHRMTDLAGAAKEDNGRIAKRRGNEKLGMIEEDSNDAEQNARKIEAERKTKAVQKRKSEKRDPKPGYCENCMDKFEDFDEHVLSRKHRKFAERAENWQDLDCLLRLLSRPRRDGYESEDE